MDREMFEKDLLELLKKHKFAYENVARVEINLESCGLLAVNVEVKL